MGPFAGTSGMVGGNCERGLPRSPPLDGGAGADASCIA